MPEGHLDVRRIEADDERALRAFAAAIPHHDRNFLKEDVTDPAVVSLWLEDSLDLRLVAADEGGRILAMATLQRGVARASHVAELRLVVAADRRGRGVGRSLAQQMMVEAFEREVHKLIVEVTAEDRGAIALFSSLGFVAEAILRDQLRDSDGAFHDVLLFAHLAADTWSELSALGVEEELA